LDLTVLKTAKMQGGYLDYSALINKLPPG